MHNPFSFLILLIYNFGVWIYSFHSLVSEMGIEEFCNCIRIAESIRIGMSGCVSGQCGSRYQHVEYHEYNHNITEHRTDFYRNLLNQSRKPWVDQLQPYHSSNSPEKAIEQIDSATQVKGESTVIPEYSTKDQFSEHTTQIFISTTKKCACYEYLTI